MSRFAFGNSFDSVFKDQLGFTRSEIRDVVREPDEVQFLKIDDLTLSFYIQKLDAYYWLVCAQERGGQILIDAGFKLFPAIYETLTEKTPLNLLKQLAENYGFQLEIEGSASRFFINQELSRKSFGQTDLVKIKEKLSQNLYQSFWLKLKDDNKIQIAVCYCIDIDRYKKHITA